MQEVIVQNFLPKPGTSMHQRPRLPARRAPVDHRRRPGWSCPPEVHLQAPPNLSDDLAPLLGVGIDDWGGVSPVTADHVNPERAWPALDILRAATEAAGFTLAPRLTVYPTFALDPERWLDPAMRFPVLDASDAEGLAATDPWCSGGEEPPPAAARTGPPAAAGPARRPRWPPAPAAPWPRCWPACALGQEVGEDEIVTLFARPRPRGARGGRGGRRAAAPRPSATTSPSCDNRNINYTNVCTFKCRFCAFSKGPLSLNLRGDALPARARRDLRPGARRPRPRGATEVCLQGGHPPQLRRRLLPRRDQGRAGRPRRPSTSTGSPPSRSPRGPAARGCRWPSTCAGCEDAGLKTLPGTAAEILDDEVRAILCPDKINTEEWLEAHRTAHGVGLRSNVTIMFGAVEQPGRWARHLVRTRDLQRETGGFTEFVPLPFVHMATPIYLQQQGPAGTRPSGRRC